MGVQDNNAQRYGNRYEKKIQYLDLFAGPGQYEDGTLSTPLIVLKKAIDNPKMRERLVATFNDADANHAASLEQSIKELPGIDLLKHKPTVFHSPVDEEIVKMLEDMAMVPTFFFADPFGYKGLSLELLNSVLKDFGSDCIFFFNYNRVNMGLPNPKVEQRMNELFGQQRADWLRQKYKDLHPREHELVIVEELSHAIREKIKSPRTATGKPFVLPFRFKSQDGRRTSHHLIFVSSNYSPSLASQLGETLSPPFAI